MMSYVDVLPAPDSLFLADLLPGIAARLGVPEFHPTAFPLPEAARYVVVLVDGLGWDITLRACSAAPYIAGVIGDSAKAEVRVPTTTAASLMSLWTGLAPGLHGVVGFSFEMAAAEAVYARGFPRITTPLFIDRPIASPQSVLDRLVEAGVAVTAVLPEEHVRSGFTAMATRQAALSGVSAAPGRDPVTLAAAASRRGERSVVYVYESRLDHAGHDAGVASRQWSQALAEVDAMLERLREELDDDVCLVVTGDHGMLDLDPGGRVVIDQAPVLRRDVRLIGGEARCRHLYTAAPRAVQARWQEAQGDAAWVATREEVVDSGLLGEVDPAYASRIGDVVVVATGDRAYLTPAFRKEYSLVGVHGGATSAERFVPVLID